MLLLSSVMVRGLPQLSAPHCSGFQDKTVRHLASGVKHLPRPGQENHASTSSNGIRVVVARPPSICAIAVSCAASASDSARMDPAGRSGGVRPRRRARRHIGLPLRRVRLRSRALFRPGMLRLVRAVVQQLVQSDVRRLDTVGDAALRGASRKASARCSGAGRRIAAIRPVRKASRVHGSKPPGSGRRPAHAEAPKMTSDAIGPEELPGVWPGKTHALSVAAKRRNVGDRGSGSVTPAFPRQSVTASPAVRASATQSLSTRDSDTACTVEIAAASSARPSAASLAARRRPTRGADLPRIAFSRVLGRWPGPPEPAPQREHPALCAGQPDHETPQTRPLPRPAPEMPPQVPLREVSRALDDRPWEERRDGRQVEAPRPRRRPARGRQAVPKRGQVLLPAPSLGARLGHDDTAGSITASAVLSSHGSRRCLATNRTAWIRCRSLSAPKVRSRAAWDRRPDHRVPSPVRKKPA